jgi:hypothetical protein
MRARSEKQSRCLQPSEYHPGISQLAAGRRAFANRFREIEKAQLDANPSFVPIARPGPSRTGLRHRQAINRAKSAGRSGPPPCHHHARDTVRWDGVRVGVSAKQVDSGHLRLCVRPTVIVHMRKLSRSEGSGPARAGRELALLTDYAHSDIWGSFEVRDQLKAKRTLPGMTAFFHVRTPRRRSPCKFRIAPSPRGQKA